LNDICHCPALTISTTLTEVGRTRIGMEMVVTGRGISYPLIVSEQ
jgi:hypothetical protein